MQAWYDDAQITDPLFTRLSPFEMGMLQMTGRDLRDHPQLHQIPNTKLIQLKYGRLMNAIRLARLVRSDSGGPCMLVLRHDVTYVVIRAPPVNSFANSRCVWIQDAHGKFDKSYWVAKCHAGECIPRGFNTDTVRHCWMGSTLAENIYKYLRAGFQVDGDPPGFVHRLFGLTRSTDVIV